MMEDPAAAARDARRASAERLLPFAVPLAAAFLGWLTLDRGWLPHDAGGLGQASERVLAGELPHRDFYDTYTGGLAFLNAAAFKILGVSVMSMRWVFFAAWLLWVPVFHAVARRVAGPWAAATGTLLVAAATLPAYPEGMPSWYNLFLATAGVGALLRHHDTGHRGWLVAAGVAGGVSIVFKIIGLYFLAGAGLYLVAREVEATRRAAADGGSPEEGPDRAYRATVLLGLAFSGLAVASVVLRSGSALMFAYFGLPPLAAVGVVSARVARPTGAPSAARFRTLVAWLLLLGLGSSLPVVIFALPWLASGALGVLWDGVFVLPQARFLSASWAPPPLVAMVPALAVAAVLAPASRTGTAGRAVATVSVVLVLGGVALAGVEGVYRAYWYLISGSGVVLAGGYTWALARRPEADAVGVLLLGVFALHALVQVPFAAPIYALYAFPLAVLVVLAAAECAPPLPRHLLHVVLAGLLLFVLLRVDAGFVYHMGFRYRPHDQTEVLELPRAGGIRVSPGEKQEYEALMRTVGGLDPGPYVFAFPDAPEVYFLTGRLNPTPSLFDFLDPDPAGRDQRALQRLDELGVRVVVLNRRPLFSGAADPAFLRALEARFPSAREVGRFLVVWREADGGG